MIQDTRELSQVDYNLIVNNMINRMILTRDKDDKLVTSDLFNRHYNIYYDGPLGKTLKDTIPEPMLPEYITIGSCCLVMDNRGIDLFHQLNIILKIRYDLELKNTNCKTILEWINGFMPSGGLDRVDRT